MENGSGRTYSHQKKRPYGSVKKTTVRTWHTLIFLEDERQYQDWRLRIVLSGWPQTLDRCGRSKGRRTGRSETPLEILAAKTLKFYCKKVKTWIDNADEYCTMI